MNSVFSLLSFSHINVIQSATLVKVFSMVPIVLFSAVWHFAGKDLLMLWSSAKPDNVTDEDMESMVREQ